MWRSFRFRIFIALLLVSLTSVSLLFAVNYRSAVDSLEQNYIRTSAENIEVQVEQIDETLSELYRTTVRAAADAGLQGAVERYLALDWTNMQDAIALSERLDSLLGEPLAAEIMYLYLPGKGQMLCSDEFHLPRTGLAPEQFPWIGGAEGGGFSPALFRDAMTGSSRWLYGYGKPLYDAKGELTAVVCAALEVRTLHYAVLDRADAGYDYYLIGTDGLISAASRTDTVGQTAERAIPETLALLGGSESVSGAEGDWLYSCLRAPFSGVRLVRLTDRGVLRGALEDTRWQFFLLLALILSMAAVLAVILGRWLYRPMDGLMESMARVGGGDLSHCPDETGQPVEFRQLSQSFNRMIDEINSLIGTLVDERTAKAEAELRALQYQIKPHFMYNTLNSIKYAAILQGSQTIADQIGAFIALLEASISKKGAFIPLSEEVQLVESYVALQRYRYMDCFTVEYDLTAQARGCYVPRLLLQPLVENAILHGMDMKRSDNHIRIASLVTDGSLWITVQDNGKGMTAEQCSRLLYARAEDDHRQFTGIGVANTRERLALHYGEQAELKLYSTPGVGTKFFLRLPASYETAGDKEGQA